MTSKTATVVHVVYAPDHAAEIPADGSLVTVVKFARRNEEVADAAAILRERDREFIITWIDRGAAVALDPAHLKTAEALLAKGLAVSLSRGEATRVRVYAEQVTDLDLN